MSTDWGARGKVKGKGLSVRDALSDFVPLEGRDPILLFTFTDIEGSDQTTYVRFLPTEDRKREMTNSAK